MPVLILLIILVVLFITTIGEYIGPRFDCFTGVKSACEAIENSYQQKPPEWKEHE